MIEVVGHLEVGMVKSNGYSNRRNTWWRRRSCLTALILDKMHRTVIIRNMFSHARPYLSVIFERRNFVFLMVFSLLFYYCF